MLNFPRGSSGAGLVLLRVTTAGLLMASAWENLSRGEASVLSVSVVMVAIFLMLGLFTAPTASLGAALTIALLLLHHGTLAASTVTVSVCVDVALLGAGAYSMDARLFGQRRVVWPDK
jgi:hypothetical protein